jgi:hypothetical protein
MKRDWTKPQMRLSPRDVASDFYSFLLFLRLGLVTFLCSLGIAIISKLGGPAIGVISCLVAFPLWWYHFGLPRFKEQQSGFFSARFCLLGYIVMSTWLVVSLLEYFGIIKEGQPIPLVRQLSPYLRVALLVGVVAYIVYEFTKRKRPNDDA